MARRKIGRFKKLVRVRIAHFKKARAKNKAFKQKVAQAHEKAYRKEAIKVAKRRGIARARGQGVRKPSPMAQSGLKYVEEKVVGARRKRKYRRSIRGSPKKTKVVYEYY